MKILFFLTKNAYPVSMIYPSFTCCTQADIDQLPDLHPMLLYLYPKEPLTIQPSATDHVFCTGCHSRFEWIRDLCVQCVQTHTDFTFVRTGSVLIVNGRLYHIPADQQIPQARKAGIDYHPLDPLFERLSRSAFRSRFHLGSKETAYIQAKGIETIQRHAYDLIGRRLAPAEPEHDGKQTPMRGHPVFIAQHATGTCCRSCLYKWHHIAKGSALSAAQQDYVIAVLMEWIYRELKKKQER